MQIGLEMTTGTEIGGKRIKSFRKGVDRSVSGRKSRRTKFSRQKMYCLIVKQNEL